MTAAELSAYLEPTWFVNSDDPAVIAFAQEAVGDARDDTERAVRLFYAVRDGVRYSAYGLDLRPEAFRASRVLETRLAWCVTKSCLLAATARAVGLPCRLGYADVRNHIATEKLLAFIGTDIFYFHGYNEFYLDGRWVKATVAFNRQLCEKARLKPLDWDGRTDSLYHEFDIEGRRHMEYLRDHGSFADVPYDRILQTFAERYPLVPRPGMKFPVDALQSAGNLDGDFEADVAREAEAKAAALRKSNGTPTRAQS
ncbi:MAG: transglutaminase-like domain-containing protein [Pirellulales bacterium]|nr:transglutaminase-like domain-containing protein [Pirellulales bacterium]